jgi:hypothetical protein
MGFMSLSFVEVLVLKLCIADLDLFDQDHPLKLPMSERYLCK